MTNFVKGQWYQKKTTKEYYQCIDTEQWLYDETTKEYRQIIDIKHNVLMVCRLAGQDTHIIAVGDANDYTHVSLIPDFSDAKAGDECFNVEEGICKIMDGKSDSLIAAMNKDGGWDAFTMNGKLEPESTHPLLFNSFAQFKAYWAEQALLMATQRRNHE